jgi:3-dehydroquinate dehydratase I
VICVSIAEESISRCREALEGVSFAEIRLDFLMSVTPDDVKGLFSNHPRLIATCRPGSTTEEDRQKILLTAIQSGAAYVDVEIESPPRFTRPIIEKARACGCQIIVSYHNYDETPDIERLEATISACYAAGADLAKIACMVRLERDNARLLGLLDGDRPIVIIGMGPLGTITRIAAPLLGSPFTFASLSKGKETAEGQLDKETLTQAMRQLAVTSGLEVRLDG